MVQCQAGALAAPAAVSSCAPPRPTGPSLLPLMPCSLLGSGCRCCGGQAPPATLLPVQRLLPMFSRAADKLKETHPDVLLAKVGLGSSTGWVCAHAHYVPHAHV